MRLTNCITFIFHNNVQPQACSAVDMLNNQLTRVYVTRVQVGILIMTVIMLYISTQDI